MKGGRKKLPTIPEESPAAPETKAMVEKEKPLADINLLSTKALDYLDDLFDHEQSTQAEEKPDLSIEPEQKVPLK